MKKNEDIHDCIYLVFVRFIIGDQNIFFLKDMFQLKRIFISLLIR